MPRKSCWNPHFSGWNFVLLGRISMFFGEDPWCLLVKTYPKPHFVKERVENRLVLPATSHGWRLRRSVGLLCWTCWGNAEEAARARLFLSRFFPGDDFVSEDDELYPLIWDIPQDISLWLYIQWQLELHFQAYLMVHPSVDELNIHFFLVQYKLLVVTYQRRVTPIRIRRSITALVIYVIL